LKASGVSHFSALKTAPNERIFKKYRKMRNSGEAADAAEEVASEVQD